MMGTGINYMPCAFKHVGYAQGALLIAVVGFFTGFALYAISIAASKSKVPNPTYSTLAIQISSLLKVLVDVSIFSACFGTNLVFYRSLARLICDMFPLKDYVSDEMGRKIVIVALGVPFLLLSLQKNLSSLKITSYITVISVSYLAVLMITYSLVIGSECAGGPIQNVSDGFSSGISYFILALSCQSNMVKVYTELENPSAGNIIKISIGAAFLGTLIYGIVGLCGYVVFGDNLKDFNSGRDRSVIDLMIRPNFILNEYLREHTFDKYALTPKFACIGAMLVLFGAFPVMMNPLCGITLSYFSREGAANENRIRTMIVAILIMVFMGLGLVEEFDIEKALQIIGATAVNMISFLYPAIYYFCSKKRMDIMACFSAVLAIGSIVAMTYMTYNIMK